MRDTFNREISYLRISLTDLCNLRCVYCMPEKGVCKLEHSKMLSLEEIVEIAGVAADLGIKKLRLTGGEPLTKKGILWLCEELKQIEGIEDLAITTNGQLLGEMAKPLADAGVDRVNISFDTLDPTRYSLITRGGDIKKTIDGINAAMDAGFKKVKINTVLIGGVNDIDIPNIVELTKDNDIDVRFIELMPMPGIDLLKDAYIPNDTVLRYVPELIDLGQDGVAHMYQKEGYIGRVGLISPRTCKFCSECNRIRLTSDGYLKPCLHSKDEIYVRGLHGEELLNKLKEAILSKPEEHALLDSDNHSNAIRNMNKIGG